MHRHKQHMPFSLPSLHKVQSISTQLSLRGSQIQAIRQSYQQQPPKVGKQTIFT